MLLAHCLQSASGARAEATCASGSIGKEVVPLDNSIATAVEICPKAGAKGGGVAHAAADVHPTVTTGR